MIKFGRSKHPKLKRTDCAVMTAGVTLDGKYSLALCEVNGRRCLGLFKCKERGGLHYSSFTDSELVTAVDGDAIRLAAGHLIGRAEDGR